MMKHIATLSIAALLVFSLAPNTGAQLPDGIEVPYTPIVTVYAEDFEAGDGGWTATGSAGVWQHGAPTYFAGPTSLPGSLNVWGTNLAGNYPNSVCAQVTSPPIEIPGVAAGGADLVQMTFDSWHRIEGFYDAAVGLASNDGGATWSVLPGDYDTASLLSSTRNCLGIGATDAAWSSSAPRAPDEWDTTTLDLTAFMGQTIQVRFAFGTDSSVIYPGFYFDNVAISMGAGASVPLPEPPESIDVPFTPVVTAYAEDFEASDGGWTATGGLWAHGAPAYFAGPNSLPGSLNAWGTNLVGSYPNYACAQVTSPPISLPAADAGAGLELARLAFDGWYRIEGYYDGAIVEASTDGGATWSVLNGDYDQDLGFYPDNCFGGDPAQAGWSLSFPAPGPDDWANHWVDATPFLGQTVEFRFNFASDYSVTYAGFYFDNVVVQVGTGGSIAVPEAPGLGLGYTPLLSAYAEDFEAGDGGWAVTGGVWEHGAPGVGGPNNLPGSLNVFGTVLNGNYPNYACAQVTSPAIVLPLLDPDVDGVQLAQVTFDSWHRIEGGYDGAILEVSTDGGATWSVVETGTYERNMFSYPDTCFGGDPNQFGWSNYNFGLSPDEWTAQSVDVTDLLGQTVQFRFNFASDYCCTYPGFFFDNFAVSIGVGVDLEA